MSQKTDFKALITGTITQISVPSGASKIRENCFNSCTELISLIMPSSVTSIENGVCNGLTQLNNVTIGENVSTIGNRAFYGCTGLKTMTFKQPSGMTISFGSEWLEMSKTAVSMTIYTDNENVKNCNYTDFNVTPKFYHLDGSAWT